MAGRPEYRAWARERPRPRHSLPMAPRGSTSRGPELPSKRGSILMEERLEALLEAEGYTVIHPQEESLERQIAIWKAARRVVALGRLGAAPGADVAVTGRRGGDPEPRPIPEHRGLHPSVPRLRRDRPAACRRGKRLLSPPGTGAS